MALSNLVSLNRKKAPPCASASIALAASTDLPKQDQSNELQLLRQQAARLEHLLQVMPAGVVVIDGKGLVKQANQLAKSLLGEPIEGQVWRSIIQRSFRPQADDGHEVSLYDGRKVKLSITPLMNEPGQLIVLTDLTETRQLQHRIGHLQRLSSLGKMVATLAHQIRTPLSAAMLYAANLANGNLGKEARQQFSDKLISRLRDLESQVNDMLLFAKSGSEQVVVDLSMHALLGEVQSAVETMVTRHDASLELVLPKDDITILGNKTALCGALQNLIHNSLLAKPSNTNIIVSVERDATRPDWLNLSVADNGPGIAADKLHAIFEPFYTTRSQGTGLGLAVVKTVAQSHHGDVAVQNLPSGGACFTLNLPVLKRQVTLPVAATDHPQSPLSPAQVARS